MNWIEQMTIMVESSRTFLWTEYARTGCGCLSQISTDPKMWDKLPVCSTLQCLWFLENIVVANLCL